MVGLLLGTVRDLLIRFLPKNIVQRVMGRGQFAFLVHPLDERDLIKKFPFMREYTPRTLKKISRFLWPIVGGSISGFETKEGVETKGWIVACPLTAEQLLDKRSLAKKRIKQTIKLAEKLGAQIVGLGAFSSISTGGGIELIDQVSINITSGNAYAAALILLNLKKALSLLNLSLDSIRVAIVGAAGSVGSACAKILAKDISLILIDNDKVELKKLEKSLKKYHKAFYLGDNLHQLKKADVVIAVTSSAEGIISKDHLKKGTLIIDAAQPKNTSDAVIKSKDFLVINSGIALMPGIKTTLDVGLFEEEVYACLAEVLILIWKGCKGNYSLGKVDPALVEELLKDSDKVGLQLANFRNEQGFISDLDFERIRKFLPVFSS